MNEVSHELATTTHGRLLSLAILISLVGGAVGSTIHDATGVALMSISLIVGLGLAYVAVGLAVESSTWFAFLGVITLPGLFFLYVVDLAVSMHNHDNLPAYGFTALGILFGLNALRGASLGGTSPHTPSAPSAPPFHHPAHAH